MSIQKGDKVKFNRDAYIASESDSPELLEIVAQGTIGTVVTVGRYPYRIVFPAPSPFKNKHIPRIAINAYAHELIKVDDDTIESLRIEELLEPLVKAYGL